MLLEPGASGRAERIVAAEDTGRAVGSSDMSILATPVLLAVGEAATINAIEASLPANSTSVSMRIHLDHVRPVPVGSRVFATARLERVEGRRLTFTIEARDGDGDLVGSGRIVRVIVDRQRFTDRIPQVR